MAPVSQPKLDQVEHKCSVFKPDQLLVFTAPPSEQKPQQHGGRS